jgi:hypothetical protein
MRSRFAAPESPEAAASVKRIGHHIVDAFSNQP